jgi:hypothetical protein
MKIGEIFSLFEGEWQFDRRITNYGLAKGTACFKKMSFNYLEYHEEGLLFQTKGIKTYIKHSCCYRLVGEEILISLRHNDNKEEISFKLEFKPIKLNHPIVAEGKYICGKDNYQTRYIFHMPNQFTTTYNVNGPNKVYITQTEYKRCL